MLTDNGLAVCATVVRLSVTYKQLPAKQFGKLLTLMPDLFKARVRPPGGISHKGIMGARSWDVVLSLTETRNPADTRHDSEAVANSRPPTPQCIRLPRRSPDVNRCIETLHPRAQVRPCP
jgi:hypothetical protein